MRYIIISVLFCFVILPVFAQVVVNNKADIIVGNGKMPQVTTGKKSDAYIVYGAGDSILYVTSKNKGVSFTSPSLIAVLPGLFASAMRGPQIAATDNGLVVTACTNKGNIYCFKRDTSGNWSKTRQLNEVDESAKEALMGLSADGLHVFAVWLSVTSPKGQNVYGVNSVDGGKTWNKNVLVYASPDSTVCECCKPSVAVKGKHVFVMFRNWLNGNRDLYLTRSDNSGTSFKKAQKLGLGSWKLNGCPMDGGGLAINESGEPQTVWRREGKIYAAIPGMPEKEIGEGKGCTIETINNKNLYTWTENGDVILITPNGEKKVLGKGTGPIVKALNNEQVLCVWENDKQVHASVLAL